MAYSPTRTGDACAIFPMSSSACIIFFTLAARGCVDFFVFIVGLDKLLSAVTSVRGPEYKHLGGDGKEAGFSSRQKFTFRPSSEILMLRFICKRLSYNGFQSLRIGQEAPRFRTVGSCP